jgi:RelB antitoxin
MATTEMVHVRIDKRTKARAAKALAAMGLSVSDYRKPDTEVLQLVRLGLHSELFG